jgi:hypothetical protein
VEVNVAVERSVFAGVADEKNKLAGIDGPLMSGVVPVAEGSGIQCKRDAPRLSRSKTDLLKAL